MADPIKQLTQVLHGGGYSLTQTRRIVFAALAEQEPQTIRQLVSRCENIDRASVYRTIGLFEQLGIVQRLHIGWKYTLELTDTFSHHHHHFTCLRCGRVIALPEDEQLEQRLQQLAAVHRLLAQDHQIEIRGLCPDCAAAVPA